MVKLQCLHFKSLKPELYLCQRGVCDEDALLQVHTLQPVAGAGEAGEADVSQ